VNIYAAIPLISVVAYAVVIGAVITRPLAKVHKVFIVFLTVAMLSSFSSFILHANFFPTQTIHWNRALLMLGGSVPVVYYHFINVFFDKSIKKRTHLGYAGLIGFTIFVAQGGMLKSSYVVDGVLYHQFDSSFYLLVLLGAIFQIMAIVRLVQGFRKASNSQDKNRIGYLLAAAGIWIIFMITNFSPTLANYSIDHIGNIANAVIISYIILRYQLLDIRLVLRKGLVYSSLTVFLTALYLLLLFILQMFFHGWIGYSSLALAAGFALAAALLFNPLRDFIQRRIDHLFYRRTYDYRQMMLHFSDRISNVLVLKELATSILDPIVDTMHVKRAALLFPETGGSVYNTRFARQASKEKSAAKLKLSSESPIVTWLATEGKILRLEQLDTIPQFKGLWEVERIALTTLGVELLCPIRTKGNLTGILDLGKKQSDSPYSDEETDLLMTMANEAAVALENARMLDNLKSQQLQVEQLLAQSVIAQEEERQRISADLHDSVAQWLVAASYQVQSCSQSLSGDGNDSVRSELADMENTITKSVKELRRVVIGLRPPALNELGLPHALRKILEELKADGIECKYRAMGTPLRLPSIVEIAVYRVVQEALNNIRKHADASKVSLRLQFQEDELMIEIHDDGQGFDLSQTLDSAVSVGRMGLLGMKKRAEMLGGNLKVKTSEGTGTTITLDLPFQSPVEN